MLEYTNVWLRCLLRGRVSPRERDTTSSWRFRKFFCLVRKNLGRALRPYGRASVVN